MRRIASVLAVSSFVLIAACGSSSKSSDSSGGDSGKALSKSEWISQSDAICKDMDSRTPKDQPPSDAKGLATFLDKNITLFGEGRSRLGALQAPSDGAQLQKDFMGKLDEAIAALKSAKAKADGGDAQAAADELNKVQGTEDLDKRLQDYGFKDCGKSS